MEVEEIETTYLLPPEIAAALMSGRSEMLIPIQTGIRQGQLLTNKEQQELLRLIGDLIKDKQEDKLKIQGMEHRMETIGVEAEELGKNLRKLESIIQGLF